MVLCSGCGRTYECSRCDAIVEEAYYNPYNQAVYYCEECAKICFVPLDYSIYKAGGEEELFELPTDLDEDETVEQPMILETAIYDNGINTRIQIYEYNDYGKLQRIIESSPERTESYVLVEYKYNEKQEIARMIQYNDKGATVSITDYTYMKNGNKKSRYVGSRLQESVVIEEETDKDGNILNRRDYINNQLNSVSENEYDENGNTIFSRSSYAPFDEVEEYLIENTYGIRENILESKTSDGKMRWVYEYNLRFQLIKEMYYLSDYIECVVSYTYNDNGKLIEEMRDYPYRDWTIIKSYDESGAILEEKEEIQGNVYLVKYFYE